LVSVWRAAVAQSVDFGAVFVQKWWIGVGGRDFALGKAVAAADSAAA
jgi:hypothetical protein